MMSGRKRIAITIGDPAGIGPECVLRAINSLQSSLCQFILVGDLIVIEMARVDLGLPFDTDLIDMIDMKMIRDPNFERNRPSARGGYASMAYVKKAVELAMNGDVDAIVTAPISKDAWRLAGLKWPGHTELLGELTNTKDYAMMFYTEGLKIILVTIHEPLRNVPGLIKKERILTTIRLARKACEMIGIERPHIAVAGLNPHAGESGLFGDEEIREIIPAINEAIALGIPVSGPYPADTIFYKAYKGEFDIIICMYHDQGLGPLKMIAFDRAVNVTVGLPIIRTSPDHGTAYDIAWKGIASSLSMIEAIKLAVRIKK